MRPDRGVVRDEGAVHHGLSLQQIVKGREDVLLVVVPLQRVVLTVLLRAMLLLLLRLRLLLRCGGHAATLRLRALRQSVWALLPQRGGVDVVDFGWDHLIRIWSPESS